MTEHHPTEHHPKPTVGRIVHFGAYDPDPNAPPLAAVVTRVYDNPDLIDCIPFQPGGSGPDGFRMVGYAQVPRRGSITQPSNHNEMGLGWDWPPRA